MTLILEDLVVFLFLGFHDCVSTFTSITIAMLLERSHISLLEFVGEFLSRALLEGREHALFRSSLFV